MDLNQIDNLVEALFQNSNFKLLLHDEIKNPTNSQVSKFNDFQTVMEDISQDLHSIIQFKLQQCVNQDLFNLIPNSLEYKKQIAELRQQISKLRTELINKQGQQVKDDKLKQLLRQQKSIQLSTISNRTKSTLNSENLQITKLKQQIEDLKITVSKLSTNSLLQFVSEANFEIHQKLEQNFTKINSEIHELSIRNSQTDLDKSIRSIGSCLYEKDNTDKITELQQQMLKYRNELQFKLQSGLKSVWNVITNMQNTIGSVKRFSPVSPTSSQAFQSPTNKTAKKGGSFSSLFGWKA